MPARFLFANPPFRQDRWSDATVPDSVKKAALNLFEELWLLHQGHDDNGNPQPILLPLEPDDKAAYVSFYNECGSIALETDEHGEAAYCKLTAYAARLALIGQLARDPNAETVTGDVMEAACELARWFGKEAVRIYAMLAETAEEREIRLLVEFIQKRGGSVSVRDVYTYHRPLRNDKAQAEYMIAVLVKQRRGEWLEPKPSSRGQPARKFLLLQASASAVLTVSRGETSNSADADTLNSQKITPLAEPDAEPVSDELNGFVPASGVTGKEPMVL